MHLQYSEDTSFVNSCFSKFSGILDGVGYHEGICTHREVVDTDIMANNTSHLEPVTAWEELLRTVMALIRTFEREMEAGLGLPLTWYDVLLQLDEAPSHRLRMQALAEAVVLSRSGLTRLVDRIEAKGLLRREHSKEDRRGTFAVLTEAGRATLERARPLHRRGIQEHFSQHLSERDIRALYQAISKVRRANLQAHESTGSQLN